MVVVTHVAAETMGAFAGASTPLIIARELLGNSQRTPLVPPKTALPSAHD